MAESLVALHATDAATVFLSAGARLAGSGGEAVQAVERALYEDRTLARMHGMRQTLFVVPAALAAVVQASTTREVAVKERASFLKFAAGGGFDAAWIAALEDETLAELRFRGRATGAELARAVPGLRAAAVYGAGTKSETKATMVTRLLRNLGMDGRIVRDRPVGTWTSSQFRWAVSDGPAEVCVDMFGVDGAGVDEFGIDEAKDMLLRCWLAAFGPGTVADLKWWTGWKVTDVRKALARVGAIEVVLADGTGFVLADDVDPVAAPEPWAALLPGLDPTPMGWQQREWYLPVAYRAALFDHSGNVGPTVWWNGEVVGGWAQRTDGEVAMRLFADVGAAASAAIEAETARWSAWVGDVRITPRFRTPLERELTK